jgi:hypothetical protein
VSFVIFFEGYFWVGAENHVLSFDSEQYKKFLYERQVCVGNLNIKSEFGKNFMFLIIQK